MNYSLSYGVVNWCLLLRGIDFICGATYPDNSLGVGKDGTHFMCDHTQHLVKGIHWSHSVVILGKMVFCVVVSVVIGGFGVRVYHRLDLISLYRWTCVVVVVVRIKLVYLCWYQIDNVCFVFILFLF